MATEKNILKVLNGLTDDSSQASIESLSSDSSDHRDKMKVVIQSKNVLAVGISEKISNEKKTGKLAITFYVEKKIPLNKLKGSEVVPPTIPESLSGGSAIPTDVIAIGKLRPEINISRKRLQPGNSIGHINSDLGTLGAVVKDTKNQLYLLSNSHVLARSGKGKIGDRILYPGRDDKGIAPGDVKAKLYRFIPFNIGNDQVNIVDCALAKPLDEFIYELHAEIKSLGLPKGTIKAKRGMKVTKVGRTSGRTSGEITDVNFRTTLNYGRGMAKIQFKDQIFCKRHYTKPGDSGSLVVDKASGKAVGLHFAGAEGGSVHNHIDEVLNALKVKLVTRPLTKKTSTGK